MLMRRFCSDQSLPKEKKQDITVLRSFRRSLRFISLLPGGGGGGGGRHKHRIWGTTHHKHRIYDNDFP